MRRTILLIAVLAALAGAMTRGSLGGLVWAAAVLAALILVRHAWVKKRT